MNVAISRKKPETRRTQFSADEKKWQEAETIEKPT